MFMVQCVWCELLRQAWCVRAGGVWLVSCGCWKVVGVVGLSGGGVSWGIGDCRLGFEVCMEEGVERVGCVALWC